MRISDWNSDVCSSDLSAPAAVDRRVQHGGGDLLPRHALSGTNRGGQSPHKAAGLRVRHRRGRRRHRKGGCLSRNHRSAERSVGKEWVSTCRSRWSSSHKKNNTYNTNHYLSTKK